MSDDLIIREDGIGRLIRGVDALEIKLQSGGTSRWVRFNPRDQKSVNANGEYHAKDDGVDGYRTITVNVPTRTKSQEPGRDQEIFNPDTGTGYYTDDDGLLHEELLPTEIRIMHVPDKTTYQDGEPIDLEGIVVQAYRDGEVWTSENYPDGYIPVHELTYLVGEKGNGAVSDLITSLPQPIQVYKSSDYRQFQIQWTILYWNSYRTIITSKEEATITYYDLPLDTSFFVYKAEQVSSHHRSVYFNIFISGPEHRESGIPVSEQFKVKTVYTIYYRDGQGDYRPDTHTSDEIVYINSRGTRAHEHGYASRTLYESVARFASLTNASDFEYSLTVPIAYEFSNYPSFEENDAGKIGWTMVYGEQIDFSGVSVLWNRPKDGKTLSDSFNVRWEDSP